MCDFMDKYIKESRAEGIAEGKAEGITEGKIKATIKTAKEFGATDDAIIKSLVKNCNLSEAEAREELQNYSE